jgi:hypothetical protein
MSMRGTGVLHGGRVLLVGLVLAAAAVAGPGPVQAQDDPPADPVVSEVNGEPITQAELHARVRFVRWQYLAEIAKYYELTGGSLGIVRDTVLYLVDSLNAPPELGRAVLAQMEEERLLWQTAAELDVVPTAEDVAEQEAAFFSLWTDVPVEELPDNPAAEAFINTWYADVEAVSGLTRDDIYQVFATEALRGALLDFLSASLPTEELTVHTRHILCAFDPNNPVSMTAPDEAHRALADGCMILAQERLEAGESFASVAADLSADASSADAGGDLGWVAINYLVERYAEAVRDAELNTLIGPVETEFGLHLIEVLDRQMEPLSEEEFEANRQGYFALWMDTLYAGAIIERAGGWLDTVPAEPGLDTLDPDVLAAVEALESAEEETSGGE